jgi:hypothetical protein
MDSIEKEIISIIQRKDLNNDVRHGLRTALEIINKHKTKNNGNKL